MIQIFNFFIQFQYGKLKEAQRDFPKSEQIFNRNSKFLVSRFVWKSSAWLEWIWKSLSTCKNLIIKIIYRACTIFECTLYKNLGWIAEINWEQNKTIKFE